MRILYHHRTLAGDGQEVHIRAMIEAFARRGVEVTEVALAPKGRAPGRGDAGCTARLLAAVTRLPRSLRELAEYAYTPVAARRLVAANRRLGADLVYERYAFANLGGLLASRRIRRPLVLEVNSPLADELAATRGLVFRGLALRTERCLVSRADLVIVVSEALSDLVVAAGADRERVRVVPNGVDLERFAPVAEVAVRETRERLGLDPSGGAPIVGWVGFFRRWHRLELLLRALAAPGLERAVLVLVGDGAIEGELRAEAESLGVARRVRFVGPQPREEVPDILAAFDVAALPGIPPYASPLKLVEYMAAGLPVVAPDQGNVTELVDDGESALLFAAGDADGLARRLAELSRSRELRGRLGRAAREAVVSRRLTWDGNVERVLEAAIELGLIEAGAVAPPLRREADGSLPTRGSRGS